MSSIFPPNAFGFCEILKYITGESAHNYFFCHFQTFPFENSFSIIESVKRRMKDAELLKGFIFEIHHEPFLKDHVFLIEQRE